MWSEACLEALDQAVADHGVDLEALRPGMRRGFPWHEPEKSWAHLRDPETWWSNAARHYAVVLEELGIDREVRAVTDGVRRRIVEESRYTLFDDVVPTLEELSDEGWRHVIVSNHIPELETLVERLGIRPMFADIITSARVGYEKPHPEIFRRALRAAVPDRPVWMVGDNVRADCLSVGDLGIEAILVRNPSDEFERYAPGLNAAAAIIRAGAGGPSFEAAESCPGDPDFDRRT